MTKFLADVKEGKVEPNLKSEPVPEEPQEDPAKMDGTTNDSPVDSISWSGFPTIYYVKAGNDTPIKYEEGRDAKSMWKYIKKNHSNPDAIKAAMEKRKAGEKK